MRPPPGPVAGQPRRAVTIEPGGGPPRGAGSAVSDIATRDRLPSLTGLRFWAALLVVLYHLTRQVGGLPPISALVYFGRSGVTFFFLLSGFVLAWTYLDTKVQLREFWWRRFARLWPLVAVTGVISIVAFAAIGKNVPLWAALSTFVFLQAWHTSWVAGANPAAWSLSNEALFYLLFPLLLAVARPTRGRAVLWVLTALSLPLLFTLALQGGWLDGRFDYHPMVRLPQFMLGVLCGVALGRGRRVAISLPGAVAAVVVYHLALFALSARFGEPGWLYRGCQWWSVIPFALLVVAAAQTDLAGRRTTLGANWSLHLGHWSFAWYLTHEMVIRLVNAWFGRPETLPAIGLRWALVLVVSLAVASTLYRWVEHPAERWLRDRGLARGNRRRGDSRIRRQPPDRRRPGAEPDRVTIGGR